MRILHEYIWLQQEGSGNSIAENVGHLKNRRNVRKLGLRKVVQPNLQYQCCEGSFYFSAHKLFFVDFVELPEQGQTLQVFFA